MTGSGLLKTTYSPHSLSLGNGKQRVKISLQLHKFVETALLGDAAVFQREQAGASAQDILVEIMSNDDARIPYSRAVKEQMLDGKLTEAVNDRKFNEKFKTIVDKIVG